LSQLAVRRQEIRVVPIKAVDVALGDEALDVDGLGALELDGVDLVIGEQDVFALRDLVALYQLRPLNRAGVRVTGQVTSESLR
jgi:hypothetical protein